MDVSQYPEERIDDTYRPSWLLMLLESRVIYDAAGMLPLLSATRLLPRGDDHPVLVLPGFLANSRSTTLLRRVLADVGYQVHRWKLGNNMGYSHGLHDGMRQRVQELAGRYGRKISLVGWSLGGVYARELAREMPDLVRQVISMGSPYRGLPDSTQLGRFFEMFSEVAFDDLPREFVDEMHLPPPVPTTALYTRGDGVVAWQSTVELSDRPDVQNIHVGGTHVGLGFNPRAILAITDRLAQPEHEWKPFEPSRLLRPLFHNWYPDWLVKGHFNPLDSKT
jgi:pimeloyl-ACP methyl ester carboxylesterase